MKKILIPFMLVLISMNSFASVNWVNVVAWALTTSLDKNKFLEDEGLNSGVGISDMWIGSEKFSFSGYYLPNHNADLQLAFSIKNKLRFTAGVKQLRKWWDTSAGHETTPGGYSLADWVPNTNTIEPLSDRDQLYTNRLMYSIQMDYLVTPLQKVSLGFRLQTHDGNITPLFRGFTFTGDVPYAATAAVIRNYNGDGQEANMKGNFAYGGFQLDFGASLQSWENLYSYTLGTYGYAAQIGETWMADDFSTNVFHANARLSRDFKRGEVFGAFAFSRMKSDPSNLLLETGTFISGGRDGSGEVSLDSMRWQLGLNWEPVKRVLLHAAASRLDRSKEGSYSEVRSDYPAVLNSDSSREVSLDQLRTRLRFLFRNFRLDLYGRYSYRKVDSLFTSTVTQSRFDKELLQDLTQTNREWREGIKVSLKLKDLVRLSAKFEAYQKNKETDLRDLTWGYYPGDADTNGIDSSYRLSHQHGKWQFYIQGQVQSWNRDIVTPYYDPIYDPTQLLAETSTEGRIQQHILTTAAQIKNTTFNVRVGYLREKFSIKDPFAEFNYQPVEYDLEGILYGLGGVFSGRTWSFAWDASFIDTTRSQSHNRIRGSLDFSKRIGDNHSLVATYKYFKFDEMEFEFDNYQGHFIAIGWRYQF